MESAPPEGSITRYIINTKIRAVEEEFAPHFISGFGADAKFENRSLGWFIFMDGSYEALHVGKEKPELQKGDRIKITLEKVDV